MMKRGRAPCGLSPPYHCVAEVSSFTRFQRRRLDKGFLLNLIPFVYWRKQTCLAFLDQLQSAWQKKYVVRMAESNLLSNEWTWFFQLV